MAVRSASARAISTPGFSTAVTNSRRSSRLSRSRSRTIGVTASIVLKMPEPAVEGSTPTIVWGRPSIDRVFPTASLAPESWRCQKAWLTTVTCSRPGVDSSAVNVRPNCGVIPQRASRLPVARTVEIRDGTSRPVSAALWNVNAPNASTVVARADQSARSGIDTPVAREPVRHAGLRLLGPRVG